MVAAPKPMLNTALPMWAMRSTAADMGLPRASFALRNFTRAWAAIVRWSSVFPLPAVPKSFSFNRGSLRPCRSATSTSSNHLSTRPNASACVGSKVDGVYFAASASSWAARASGVFPCVSVPSKTLSAKAQSISKSSPMCGGGSSRLWANKSWASFSISLNSASISLLSPVNSSPSPSSMNA